MEFTHDYRVVFEPEPDHPALAGLQPAEQGGFYIRDIFSRYDAALDERSEFSHRHEFVSRLGDTAITNLQRLEALQNIVTAALHHWPSLHQVDPRSLPAH